MIFVMPAGFVHVPELVNVRIVGAPAPVIAVVCIVPSGNFTPPEVVSMVPATVSFCPGLAVPIPTLPEVW
ncbi:hypothetical protein A3A38_03630 [Candidatus Kaiserbacteria bacterium RIFCSPLOWO2_01_FULL_53_17]|uniref:Uncharacterized protein n=1 Tax=Candidatus Kaiserbacteria bacterium RIFCSPLOWO2_01_FULL_53_17 TaxID=1798511 RepID=A0A1F6EGE9_9BACT|nr:MAG: hypothetical protein A3A38_03630 [Candidatus Kaiserbacteria bacterium RIFCSPLOWO2_01_FULL_53_17]